MRGRRGKWCLSVEAGRWGREGRGRCRAGRKRGGSNERSSATREVEGGEVEGGRSSERMVSCATVKSPLGIIKLVLIVSVLTL